jgi:DNA-binding response OmpR family regulator
MGKPEVLLVEDARDMHIIVESAIGDLCTLTFASTLQDAEKILSTKSFALMILDVLLPDGEGFAFCEKIKLTDRHQNLPVIFLTGENEIQQKVRGFSVGADDYVIKPLEPIEFAARVAAKLKKVAQNSASVAAAGLRIELATHRVFYKTESGQEQRLPLTPIEAKIITQLLKNPGKVITREDLMKSVWGEDVHISAHTVDTHMSSLRKKLGPVGEQLKAVSRQGFSFMPISAIPSGDSNSDH